MQNFYFYTFYFFIFYFFLYIFWGVGWTQPTRPGHWPKPVTRLGHMKHAWTKSRVHEQINSKQTADSELKRKAGKKSKRLIWFFCRKFTRDCWGRRSCFQVSSCSFCLSFLFVSFPLFIRPSPVCVLSPSVLRWRDEDKCGADSPLCVAPCLFPFVPPSVLFSGLSLSTPYLFPCLFSFVPVLLEETRKTVCYSGSSSVFVFCRSSLSPCFFFSSPSVFFFLSTVFFVSVFLVPCRSWPFFPSLVDLFL